MKKMFSIAVLLITIASVSFAQTPSTPSSTGATLVDPAANPNAPEFKWVEETHDFGTIPQGTPVTNKFEFVNVGKEPLIVSKVDKTCGCTVTDWTKEPINPGEKGFVMAEFNAAKEGPFTKGITVQSNAKTPAVKLYFKGTVQKTEQTSGAPENKTIFDNHGH